MGTKTAIQGGAYEFACMTALHKYLSQVRSVSVDKNKRYSVAEAAWNSLTPEQKDIFEISADTAVRELVKMEPLILEGDDTLELRFQKNTKGEDGDVRDILIIRVGACWEIGLSIKHNHFAVKHSRLAEKLDFCKSWFDIPCSDQYWKEIDPVFSLLLEFKERGASFSEIENKDELIYIPVLNAFCKELRYQFERHKETPALLVEYLLGRYDFYKLVSVDSQELTMIQAYNLHGALNRRGMNTRPETIVPVVDFPTRLMYMGFKPGSSTTIELIMDKGWSFTFRIHNASSRCEPSLKFDIQIVGMPTNIICIRTSWRTK